MSPFVAPLLLSYARPARPNSASRLRVGDDVDARSEQAGQLGCGVAGDSGSAPGAGFLTADDAVKLLVQARLLGREVPEPSRDEALRGDQPAEPFTWSDHHSQSPNISFAA